MEFYLINVVTSNYTNVSECFNYLLNALYGRVFEFQSSWMVLERNVPARFALGLYSSEIVE